MNPDESLSEARWPAAEAAMPRASGLPRPWFRAPAEVGRTLLDLVYPPGCMACSAPASTPDGLCARCWQELRFIEAPFCARLGTPFAADLGPGLISPEAIANPPVYSRARAVVCFDSGPAQALVHRLKYGDRPDYARTLGRWMARAGAELIAGCDVVVPIPLHRRRLWYRRFNQAAFLAQALVDRTGKRLDLHSLQRVKATTSQVGMSRAERAENIQGAFRITDDAAMRFRGQRVLLVDDVLTTGATVNAGARILLRGGATRVDVLVFARVVTSA